MAKDKKCDVHLPFDVWLELKTLQHNHEIKSIGELIVKVLREYLKHLGKGE